MSYATPRAPLVSAKDFYWTHLGLSFPSDMVTIGRRGVLSAMVKSLAEKLSLTTVRLAQIIGVPKATLERKAASDTLVTGGSAYAALGTARLINTVQNMLDDSTHPDTKTTDAAKWLGQWIERPQPALGGQTPLT